MSKIYNHIKDLIDKRDLKLEMHCKLSEISVLPDSFNLKNTGNLPDILDQQNLGSCGANEISNALKFLLKKEKLQLFQPSRLFIYYFARLLDNSDTTQDTGINIRSGMKSISKYGVCWESSWTYDISKFSIEPSSLIKNESIWREKGFKYYSVNQDLSSIKQALYSGFPVIIGIQVYTSFESDLVANSGIGTIPDISKEQNLGGHCVLIIGYSDKDNTFTLMNSWGKNWGQNGFFTLPYNYVTNSDLADSFWVASYFEK